MANRWMITMMMVGVCWLAACGDGDRTSERAETPRPTEDARDAEAAPTAQPAIAPEAEAVVAPVVEEAVEQSPAEPEVELVGWRSFEPDTPTEPKPAVEAPEPVVEEPVEEVVESPVEVSLADAPAIKPLMQPVVVVASVDEPEAEAVADDDVPAVLNFTMTMLDGTEKDLADYQGKVLLVVNTASRCGYTPQYAGLQALHETYADEGLAVLGFPANNFGGQEPGTDSEIETFCTTHYGVTFDMFSKISVAGGDRHAFYDALTASDSSAIGWNFEKFLIGRDGTVIAHYRSDTAPSDAGLTAAIQAELDKDE